MSEFREEFNDVVQFRTTLRPSKSMDEAGRCILHGGVIGALSSAFAAVAMGLWPVAVPLVLVAGGLVEAQRRIQIKQRQCETLTLTDKSLKIERFKTPEATPIVTDINPFMAKVEAQLDHFKNCQRVLIKSGGKAYEVGQFLAPQTKAELAQTLSRELGKWSTPQPPQSLNA